MSVPDAQLTCGKCSAELGPGVLSCPFCHRLVHADRLSELASEAAAAREREDRDAEVAAWRSALDLLPPGTKQEAQLRARIDELVDGGETSAKPERSEPSYRAQWMKAGGAIGAIGLLAWKFKAVLAFIVTKGKVLLLGLTKSGTLFSMLASLGVYWTLWGWKFALGLVLSLYVHEMGHVAELKRRGFPASGPMFIPGLGAFVRLRQPPVSRAEDARIGLAGPIWGLGAAVACWLVFLVTGAPLLGAVARVGAWLNLFNLLPVWQLDGSRGFAALTRSQRVLATGSLVGAGVVTAEASLYLIAFAAAVRCFGRDRPDEPDWPVLAWYVGLVACLSALMMISVPGVGG